MSNVDFLVKLRDAAHMIADACEEYLEKMAPSETKQGAAVKEETFNILKFEAQEGAKIGSYEVAYKANNLEDKWSHAHNVLKQNNSTINSRYYGEGYQFSFWLFGEGKIYRQKLRLKR